MCWGCTLRHSATSYGLAQEGTLSSEAGSLRNGGARDKKLLGMYPYAPETMIESGSKRVDGKGTEGNKTTKEIKSKELQRQPIPKDISTTYRECKAYDTLLFQSEWHSQLLHLTPTPARVIRANSRYLGRRGSAQMRLAGQAALAADV